MATKSKKKPAPRKKKPATAKKPASKPKLAAPKMGADVVRLTGELQTLHAELQSVQGELRTAQGELQSAKAERDKLRADVTAAVDRHRTQATELEQLRGATLKGAADVGAAARRAEEAGRRADERENERLRLSRELETATSQLSAARAELGGYKLRCPKCGKNFVEEVYEGITIDRCTGCDAVYFDAGEVDQLILKVHEKTSSPTADPQQTSGWFRGLFKRKGKPEPTGGGDQPPPVA